MITLAYKDSEDIEKTDWLLYELKYMKTAGHVDLIDSLLRADTVIRKYYYKGTSDPNFSVRKWKDDDKEYQPTDMEMEGLTVFGRPSAREINRFKRKREQEERYKTRMNNLNEDVRINLSRDR